MSKAFFSSVIQSCEKLLKWLIFIEQSFCEVEGSERPDVKLFWSERFNWLFCVPAITAFF